ncbi:MAG: CoA-acylating methylmalonate-semialdehyde dehydrogenase [Bacillota bacterium]|jgi:malonate-semialdehyde dehydrogenase (acetylating)/methylmalonate-semialdehyde dehydrogenase|nr:CoA-acylating methylmalonate-semialdehyde dehydrogenase [Bacillota bacterium]HHU43949.1 CoA-acylating methylmalonate-semialdehyde dehydrogenase [Clostridiales bacterium]
MKILKYFTNNQFVESKTDKYYDVFNPSTGEQIAKCPRITTEEVRQVIENAQKGYEVWSSMPVTRRVQVLYKVKQLLEENLEELTILLATEHGKAYREAQGDVLKAIEGTDLAIHTPVLMQGDSLMDTSRGYDTVLYREPLGVFAGIAPFNFPAMIPMGWMAPNCIAAGNAMVLKVSGATPMSALRIAELYREAGLPDGVLNVISCDRVDTKELLTNPLIKGISFVGSTKVGKFIYKTGAEHGKRVQALCEAKNHALVLEDAALDRTAAGIINAAFGCAGERCMALPVVVAQESIADQLVAKIKELAQKIKVGPAYHKETGMGPVYSQGHKESVLKWIEKGIEEGAKLILDGRDIVVEGYENGFYIGPTVFDHVTEDMSIGQEEIFGPVLCIKRVKNFEEGLKIMNNNRFANGSVIYTQSGYYSREFARNTHGGMVGINVGIPVPIGIFPFCGHKDSFFGDLHCLGKDAYRFYTESKAVTTHWFDEEEMKNTQVSTWDGTI